MKNLFLLLVCGLCFQSVGSFAQGYKIQVNIPQMSNKQVILANYFEGKVYAVDTPKSIATVRDISRKTIKNWHGECIFSFSPPVIISIL